MRNKTSKPYAWPTWPVDNALAILKEDIERIKKHHSPDKEEYVKGVDNALRLAVSVIEGINQKQGPQPPSLRLIIRNATGEFVSGIASAMHSAANILEEANEWGWKRDPYD